MTRGNGLPLLVIRSGGNFWTGADWSPIVGDAQTFTALGDAMDGRYEAKRHPDRKGIVEIWADCGTNHERKVMP